MILKRNFRYRHPISAKIINDYFSDILEEIVYFLGISNTKTEKDGIIKEDISSADTLSELDMDIDNTLIGKCTIERYNRRF
jgi:hypothetical protein